MKLLAVEGLTVLRGGHGLLEQIRCEIRAGQVTGIISDNPDRLQLFLNVLGGVEAEQGGKILFSGRPWSFRQRLRGVGIAREQVSLVDTLSVLDNLFLSNSRRFTWMGFIHRSRRRRHALQVLRRLETQVSLDWTVQRVDPSTKVMLDIGRVLIKDPDFYVFHGVTRAMNLRQYEAFLNLVRSLKAAGKGLLITPINAEDVRTLVDRLYYLQGTQLFEVDQSQDLSDEQLLEFFLGNEKKRYKPSNDPIQQAKQLIQERFAAEEVDFQQVAETLAMSYDNFRRRFKAQVGQSPNQYFVSVKMDRAKELLLDTDLDVKDIAVQLGFADPYYFSRVFKERTGSSPIHFRQGNRDDG